MKYEKRKFMRFDIPLLIEFKPAEGDCEYTYGITKNFSYEGFGFESLKTTDLKLDEAMEFKLKFPRWRMSFTVMGDVVWKKYVENRRTAGVKLRDIGKENKRNLLEKISTYKNVPPDSLLYSSESEIATEKKSDKGSEEKSSRETEKSGIEKQYLESKSVCRVTFRLPKAAAPETQSVTIVGDFNNWNLTDTPMKRLKNGDFALTLELPSNKEYRYRYFIDSCRWENDWFADKYAPNPYGSDDSIVVV